MQVIDKTARNRVFNSRYWKEECFALDAQSLIDKGIELRCVGGLFGGAKHPTRFLCLLCKMLQMGLPSDIVQQYLRATDYKYLNALALFYVRLTLKPPGLFLALQHFYTDKRKLRMRDHEGHFHLLYFDQMADQLLNEEVVFGITLPFIPKRHLLQDQGLLDPRKSLLDSSEIKEGSQ